MEPVISFVGEARTRLGESPVWDPVLKCLFWVDSVGPAVWRFDPATGAQTSIAAPDHIGSIVLGEPGQLIVGLRHRVCRLDVASGVFTTLISVEGMAANERLNDGKTDRQGRFVTGSLTAVGTHPPVGKLYRFDKDAAPEIFETGIEVSNATCFSPAGDRLYFADSVQMAVWSYPYDGLTGAVGPREVLIDTRSLGSVPDGATVDAEGYLWVALVLAHKLGRFAPDGTLDRLIDSPIPYPSCPAFGGEAMDTLYVTAISDSGGRLITDHADGGRLMAISHPGATGIVETRCRL